jgi:Rrf2 family protein
MADLALHAGGSPVALNSIAQRQNLSDGYLESMFGTLRRAGLVRSVKGAGGGYVLSKPAADISVCEVLQALEGDLSIVDDDEKDNDKVSLRYYIKRNVWDAVSGRIHSVVGTLSLEELVNSKCTEKEGEAYAD